MNKSCEEVSINLVATESNSDDWWNTGKKLLTRIVNSFTEEKVQSMSDKMRKGYSG
jgi:hypothetical protein